MAKSARASTRKRNNVNLRTKVFGPAQDARLERLSAKLQEIANAPKPETEKAMEVDDNEKEEEINPEAEALQDDKDEAMKWGGTTTSSKSSRGKMSYGKVVKRVPRRKAKAQMVFPSEIARRKRQTNTKKT